MWWDGDQSLVEERTAEGASDVSNSGTVGNINALSLDEPLAVITTNPSTETRIINYNWRGQAMSSVFPSGEGADYLTGSTSAEVDWAAQTQAETYFTPNLDGQEQDYNPRKWLGTFVQNGIGTTGMLYRRNRYFDPNTGRFTQEDPIGIAGGVNQYGFAQGDPVNFSDPFGLWPEIPGVANLVARGIWREGLLNQSLDIAIGVTAGLEVLGEGAIAATGLLNPASKGEIRGLIAGAKHTLSEGLARVTRDLGDKALVKTYHGAIDQVNRHKEILLRATPEQVNSIMRDIVKHEKRLQAAWEEIVRRGLTP